MIFFTTGETVHLALEAVGQPGYRHYKADDYESHPRCRRLVPAFRDDWRPFLVSGSEASRDRQRALDAFARALTAG